MRGWKDLEVVETIYEEDQEEDGDGSMASSLLLTPSPTITPSPPHSSSPPPPSLQSRVEAWSNATGCKTDVIVRVQDQCFHLHRDPLITRSGYLRRKLTESSDVTVSPPSGITAETFSEIARFCYGSDAALTPSNLAALWVAAEWLEMAEDDADGGGSLLRRTEAYFRQEVAGEADRAAVVLRACVGLIHGTASEPAASLATRCVEVLAREDCAGGAWLDDVVALPAEQFGVVAESMRAWFAHDHDLLYRIVDHYIHNHGGKLTEEEKTRICYTVNCTKLSDNLLVHLVQNPRLPLRFVVQAMLVDQLHVRHSILGAPPTAAVPRKPQSGANGGGGLTLGAILQRDAALRQAAHLRASMEATSFRIESLERDLAGLRGRLRWSEEKRAEMEAARSESFRFARHEGEVAAVAAPGNSCSGNSSVGNGRNFGRRLMQGLRSVFRTSSSAKAEAESRVRSNGIEGEERTPGHGRNHSFA